MVVPEDTEHTPLDLLGQLEAVVAKSPTDYGSWTKLIDQVTIKDEEEKVRSTFDKYLSIFKFDVCNLKQFQFFCIEHLLTLRPNNGEIILTSSLIELILKG